MSKKISFFFILNLILIGTILFMFGYRPNKDYIYKEHMTSFGTKTYTILYENKNMAIVRFDDMVYEIIEFEDTLIFPKEKDHRFDVYNLVEIYPSYALANTFLYYYEIPIQSDLTFEQRANQKPASITEYGDGESNEITEIFVYNSTKQDIELRSYDPSLENPTYEPLISQRIDLDENSYLLKLDTAFVLDDFHNLTAFLNGEVYVAENEDNKTYQNIRIDGIALDPNIKIHLPQNFNELLGPVETAYDLDSAQEVLYIDRSYIDRYSWDKFYNATTFYKTDDQNIVSYNYYDLQSIIDIDTFNRLMTYIQEQLN